MLRRLSLALCLILTVAAGFAQSDVANVTQLHIHLKPQAAHTPKTVLTGSEAAGLSRPPSPYPAWQSWQKDLVNAVNESGLYHLIDRCDKLEAGRFQHWLTSEVVNQRS